MGELLVQKIKTILAHLVGVTQHGFAGLLINKQATYMTAVVSAFQASSLGFPAASENWRSVPCSSSL
ncbi:hypothetical protein BA011_05020 [Rhizobium leguminosarum]|uniref:Uncharacterized protein n=1 Tax=Rhizobium leguminosarum TaxID=384 RepID=A0A1B1C5X0_RHILE|nr:hypothetical protein BA011_05020 [Rhizobium leguminosarum]